MKGSQHLAEVDRVAAKRDSVPVGLLQQHLYRPRLARAPSELLIVPFGHGNVVFPPQIFLTDPFYTPKGRQFLPCGLLSAASFCECRKGKLLVNLGGDALLIGHGE